MRLSVMLFPFDTMLADDPRCADQVVRSLQAEGVGAVEPCLSWVEAQPATWEAFDRAAKQAGMAYSCCDIAVDLVGEDESARAVALERVVSGVELCRAELACPLALLAGTKPAPGMSDAEGRRAYGQALAEASERTRGSGVTLTIEDFGMYPSFTASAAHCLEALEAANCPDIRFTFDNGNFLLGDDTPTRAYPLLKDRTVHVHIKDFAIARPDEKPLLTSPNGVPYKGCAIGDGEAEVAACLALLKADGYDGWVSLEVGGAGDPVDDVIQGARLVRRVWEGA